MKSNTSSVSRSPRRVFLALLGLGPAAVVVPAVAAGVLPTAQFVEDPFIAASRLAEQLRLEMENIERKEGDSDAYWGARGAWCEAEKAAVATQATTAEGIIVKLEGFHRALTSPCTDGSLYAAERWTGALQDLKVLRRP